MPAVQAENKIKNRPISILGLPDSFDKTLVLTGRKYPRPLNEQLSKVVRVLNNAPPSRDEQLLAMGPTNGLQI